MGRHFPGRENSGNFVQTGKLREKSGKISQKAGKLRELLVIFKLTVYYLLKWIKFSVLKNKTWKKYWKSQ